jgi:hypothetical protein
MSSYYLEVRSPGTANAQLAMDIAKHLQRRQSLGTAIVVCDKPLALMCVVRKFWMKLARNLQRERASTVNAQKILHLTYAVTHMHHMTFVAKTPSQVPDADVFFVSPEQLTSAIPERCLTLYVIDKAPKKILAQAIPQLANQALVVDYAQQLEHALPTLLPKSQLTKQVRESWQLVDAFLQERQINVAAIAAAAPFHTSKIDDALDILLDQSQAFLRVAGDFHHLLQLAQPLDLSHETQLTYNTASLLAHRVQALSTNNLQQFFDAMPDTFFLRDGGAEEPKPHTLLAAAAVWHEQHGHNRIGAALRALAAQLPGWLQGPLPADILPLL